MNVNQIRIELLEQHAQLRALIEQVRVETSGTSAATLEASPGLSLWTERLASALEAHNSREESLLDGILATVDACGPARAEIMTERHAAEHRELTQELVDAASNPSRMRQLLDRILMHMDYEEQAFLNEDVLREDSIVINAFGG